MSPPVEPGSTVEPDSRPVEPVETPGRRLILLRHGRTAWNRTGRAQGHADVGLDEVGRMQAETLAAHLAWLEPMALWSSDLARARQTCGYLERLTGLTATYDPRLREYDVGDRQGLTLEEFAARWPAEHASWVDGDDMVRVPGAETTADIESRMVPALCECLAALAPGETGVVVTHGAALKVGVFGLLGWPQSLSTGLRGIDNCAWVTLEELETGGRLRLAGYNQSTLGNPAFSPVM